MKESQKTRSLRQMAPETARRQMEASGIVPGAFSGAEERPGSDRQLRVTKGSLATLNVARKHTLGEREESAEHPVVDGGRTPVAGGRKKTASTPMPACAGRTLGKHHLISLLGKGGMGNVYLAQDNTLMRRVAYKSLHPDKAARPDLVQRFLREVQINAQLDHQGVAPVYTLLSEDGSTPAYTMKVIEGCTLEELLKKIERWYLYQQEEGQPLPDKFSLNTRLEYLLKVCDTMSYAHNKGVLHRDLKPDNIMLGQFGEVYVVDWGIACLLKDRQKIEPSSQKASGSRDAFQTEVGQLVGTPRYMSPEQARGELDRVDQRSDIYALGLILFELVSLRHALPVESRSKILKHASEGRLQDFVHICDRIEIPSALKAIVCKATAYEPDDRYPTVTAFADDIRRYLRDEAVSAAPDSRSQALLRTMRKHQKHVVLTMVILILAMIGLNGWWLYRQAQVKVEAQRQQQTLAHRLLAVARQSHEIDHRFFRWERLLDRLAQATQVALVHGKMSPAPYLLHRNFAPSDLRWSPLYRDKLSTHWPVTRLPQGAQESTLRTQLQRLALLRPQLRSVLFDADTQLSRRKPSRLEQLLVQGGLPLLSSFVATREGVIVLFPGRGNYPDSYDPRKRPWFREIAGKRGVRWSKPYVSSQKIRAIVMACTTAVFNEKGRFLAVAGLDLRVNRMVHELRKITRRTVWVKESYLLQQDGSIVVQTSHLLQRVAGKHVINQSLRMPKFANPILQRRMKRGDPQGYFYRKTPRGPQLVVFVRLRSQPWYYVVVGE